MADTVTIKVSESEECGFSIHTKKAVQMNLNEKKYAFVSFGSQKQYVSIEIDNDLPEENIMISKGLQNKLHLPDYPVYEISVEKNEIRIGPFIGLLLSKKENHLTTRRLKRLLVYVREYPRLHGCIVVFPLNKVDVEKRLIEGYCYHYGERNWQKGVFPFPAAIYRTIGLSDEWKNCFLSVIGERFFNSHYFNKWTMYQWFSMDKNLSPHIPYTLLYKSYRDVIDMLERYKKIYIKPVSGLRGHGIVKASIEEHIFVFKHREKGINYTDKFDNKSKAIEYIQEYFKNRKFLIQQAVDLLEYEDGLIDFRCIMQKEQIDRWKCYAVIARNGDKDSVVSNISSGGRAYKAVEILNKVVYSPEHDVLSTEEKITDLAFEVCNALDDFGVNCGTLGLDIGVDTQGFLWIIEINNRDPDPTIALDINDEPLYYTLKTAPMFYAKTLAGFKNTDYLS